MITLAEQVMDDEQRERLMDIMDLIEPWSTNCDYRAEPDLQKAVELINELLLS